MILFFSSTAKYNHSEKLYHIVTLHAGKCDMKHTHDKWLILLPLKEELFTSHYSLLNSQDYTLMFIKITNRSDFLTCANPMATRTLKNKDAPSHFHESIKPWTRRDTCISLSLWSSIVGWKPACFSHFHLQIPFYYLAFSIVVVIV